MKTYQTIIIAAVILILGGFSYWRLTGLFVAHNYDDFAKCLTEEGVTMYGSFQCSHCTAQKEVFGTSIKYINYIECGPLTGPVNKQCIDAGIEAYPTWIIDGTKYTGVQSLNRLAELTGCPIK